MTSLFRHVWLRGFKGGRQVGLKPVFGLVRLAVTYLRWRVNVNVKFTFKLSSRLMFLILRAIHSSPLLCLSALALLRQSIAEAEDRRVRTNRLPYLRAGM